MGERKIRTEIERGGETEIERIVDNVLGLLTL